MLYIQALNPITGNWNDFLNYPTNERNEAERNAAILRKILKTRIRIVGLFDVVWQDPPGTKFIKLLITPYVIKNKIK